MAQRTIHLLIGKILETRIQINDTGRFLLGSILPDAINSREARMKSHYILETDDKLNCFMNFSEFKKQYGELILKDDLYLGYYMHIVEDALYRYFLNSEYDFQNQVITDADVATLHNDYRAINIHIIEKYKLPNLVKKSKLFEKERINEITTFQLDEFLNDMQSDFNHYQRRKTMFLTEAMVDEFIEKNLDLCLKELDEIKREQLFLNPLDYKWLK